jgi:3-hydroxyacyl-CoA dehydrogenase
MFLVGTDQMEAGKYISSTIRKLLTNLAYVMAGGDLSEPLVSEQYLLDLEREAFLSLCTERKNIRKNQFMLTKGNHYVIKKIRKDAKQMLNVISPFKIYL